MNLNSIITTGKIEHNRRWVIYGPEGVGKSTLASHFPNPLFIDLENGTRDLDVPRINCPINTFGMLQEIVDAVAKSDYDTIIFDTADYIELLMSSDICTAHKVSNIAKMGYGTGFAELKATFAKFLDRLTLIDKQIVILAHAGIEKFDQPDDLPSFDRWGIKLDKRTASLLKEWADEVLFMNFKTYAETDAKDKVHGKGGKKRVIYASHTATHEGKDRSGTLAEEIPAEYTAIEHLTNVSKRGVETKSSALEDLRKLMESDGIGEQEVRAAQVAVCKAYPIEAAIDVYDERVINRIINGWAGVKRWISVNYTAA